jgi:hypothetical protein
MSAWRWRRCPRCGGVERASDYECLDVGPSWNADGPMDRRCPNCSYVAATWRFQVVRERRQDAYAGGTVLTRVGG